MRPTISLPSKADAEAFLDAEEKLWSWIADGAGHSNSQINNFANKYSPQNWIPRFRTALGRDDANEFIQLMHERYGSNGLLCGIDPEARALQTLGEVDKFTASVALAQIHGEIPTNDQNFLRTDVRNRSGVAHGNALLAGIDPSVLAGTNRELMETKAQIDIETQKMRALIERSSIEENSDQIKASAHALGASHEEAFSKAEAERNEAYEKLRDALEATLKAFERRMELQAPVAYWRCRANQYRRTSSWALGFLLVFAVSSVYGLFRLYDIAASHLPTDAATIPYAALFRASAFALLMTSIAFWAGRVLLRIYLSARHLATDAEERRTMITTFLALTKKSVLNDEDRKFILAPLFRPGADGIVSEEAAPDTMFAALMGSILKK